MHIAKQTYKHPHTIHIMKRVSTSVEDVSVHSHSMVKYQKRLVTRYICACKEEDVLYREVGRGDFVISEYTREVVKK